MSVDEDPVYRGPILAKARVKSDYTPSPYDKEALALKVLYDILDVAAHNK